MSGETTLKMLSDVNEKTRKQPTKIVASNEMTAFLIQAHGLKCDKM